MIRNLIRQRRFMRVRSPNGSFPAPTILATGSDIVNVGAAITPSGDAVAVWRQSYPDPSSCLYTAATGAFFRAGAWDPPTQLGPRASIPAFPTGAFSAGANVVVPIVERADAGTPCSFLDDTVGMTTRHFRAQAGGFIDLGNTELSAPAGGSPQLLDLAIEPGGKLLAYFRIVDNMTNPKYLRAFDGAFLTPGVTPTPTPTPGPGGTGGSSGTPASNPGASPTPPKPIAPIKPRNLLVRYKRINPMDPAVILDCGAESIQKGQLGGIDCGSSLKLFTAFFSRNPPKASVAASKPVLLATGKGKAAAGKRKRIKLRLTPAGRRLVRRGRAVKVTLQAKVTVGNRSATERLSVRLSARRKR